MTTPAVTPAAAVPTRVLRHAIARELPELEVGAIRRTPSAYATSCLLEELTVHLGDGTVRRLMLKHLSPSARHAQVTRIKPASLLDPEREINVYREILAPRRLGARWYGSSREGASWPWLLVEKVDGVEMYQIGDLAAWRAAARWIGALHHAVPIGDLRAERWAAPLARYDRAFCRYWMERTLRFFSEEAPRSRLDRGALTWLAARFDRVVDYLLALPAAFIHGEYYASNVLAVERGGDWRVCPVDWEMAAIGPAVLDLAALASGDWSPAERAAILAGYEEAAGPFLVANLDEAVDYAQVYLAVQWLGWFGRRRAPSEHTRDWLADAVDRAEKLNL